MSVKQTIPDYIACIREGVPELIESWQPQWLESEEAWTRGCHLRPFSVEDQYVLSLMLDNQLRWQEYTPQSILMDNLGTILPIMYSTVQELYTSTFLSEIASWQPIDDKDRATVDFIDKGGTSHREVMRPLIMTFSSDQEFGLCQVCSSPPKGTPLSRCDDPYKMKEFRYLWKKTFYQEVLRRLYGACHLSIECENLLDAGKIFPFNFVIASDYLFETHIRRQPTFVRIEDGLQPEKDIPGYRGIIDNCVVVVDPGLDNNLEKNRALVGYRKSYVEAPLILSPYIPFFVTDSVIIGEALKRLRSVVLSCGIEVVREDLLSWVTIK
jgi:hypothetical protein